MNFVNILLDVSYGNYSCKYASNIELEILGHFFTSDVRCNGKDSFRQWALVSEDGDGCSGNITALEKVGNDITLADLYSEEQIPTKLRMTTKQFVQLFDEWQNKVVKLMPKEVIIKHEDGQFFIETDNRN